MANAHYLLLILIGLLSFNSQSQIEQDPKKFLRGDFEYCRIETASIVYYKKKNMKEVIQIEDGEIKIESRIDWIDETNYVLTAQKVDGSDIPVDTKLYISILSIKDNKMIYNYYLEGQEPRQNCLFKLD